MIEIKKRLSSSNLKRSFWALADQLVVSLGNFCTNVLLARSLPQVDYGTYGLILGVWLFLNGIQNSLIIYPLSVNGAKVERLELRRITSISLVMTSIFIIPLSLGILGATHALHKIYLAPWVLVAMLFWQFQEVFRRSLMSQLRHRDAIWGDSLSYLGQAILIWFIAKENNFSLEAVFQIMAFTSGLALVVQIFQVGLHSFVFKDLYQVAKNFWKLGRWSVGSSLLSFFNSQAIPWTLGFFYGLEVTAKLQAVANLMSAAHPVMFSIAGLIVPAVARTHLEKGIEAGLQTAKNYAIQGAVFIGSYFLILAIWPKSSLSVFYGSQSPYLNLETEVRMFVVFYVILYAHQIMVGFLNGLEKSQFAFIAQAAGNASSLLISIPLTIYAGLIGGLLGGIVSSFILMITCIFFIRKMLSKTDINFL